MESFKVTTEVKRSVNAITEIGMGGCAIPAAPRSGKNSKPKENRYSSSFKPLSLLIKLINSR